MKSSAENIKTLIFTICLNRIYFYVKFIENLAQLDGFKGIPSQSSSYSDRPWGPDKAVDGRLQEQAWENTCSFTVGDTSNPVTKAWWKFPLLQLSNVAYLQIYFRNGSMWLTFS